MNFKRTKNFDSKVKKTYFVLATTYCPAGWELFADSCYKFGDGEETWSSALSWLI